MFIIAAFRAYRAYRAYRASDVHLTPLQDASDFLTDAT